MDDLHILGNSENTSITKNTVLNSVKNSWYSVQKHEIIYCSTKINAQNCK